MEPIFLRTDDTLAQALRCVEFRIPKPRAFKPPGFILALGLRYGIIGMAACHHLLVTSDIRDETAILDTVDLYPQMVEDHVRWELGQTLPFSRESALPHVIGRIAAMPIQTYLPLVQRLYPLGAAIEQVSNQLLQAQREMIIEGWRWWQRGRAARNFERHLEETGRYAMHFFDRRQSGVAEVREILLLGE